MGDSMRCEECGSWGVECSNDPPVADCDCARCACVRRDALAAEVTRLRAELRLAADVIGEAMRGLARVAEVAREAGTLTAALDALDGAAEAESSQSDLSFFASLKSFSYDPAHDCPDSGPCSVCLRRRHRELEEAELARIAREGY